jgi:hypothetical protein
MTPQERIDAAMAVIVDFGDIDGAHHKQWVIDNIARCLLDHEYEAWVDAMSESDMPWDEGIAP